MKYQAFGINNDKVVLSTGSVCKMHSIHIYFTPHVQRAQKVLQK